MVDFETDVLIVGSGPAGGTAALFLSTYGVDNVMIERYRWLADTPRAHITKQRTVEIMRDMGLEGEVIAKGTPQHLMGDQVFCESLAGEEIARLRTWGTHPRRQADFDLASPSQICDLPQDLFEPIFVGAAQKRGTKMLYNTEYLSLEQDDDGVTATVRDRVADRTYQVRAKYLIGADGGRSRIADDVGLPFDGEMDIAGSMNIVFHADLSRYVAHRPSVLYWVMQPGSDIGGIGMGLVRMVRPWWRWLIVWGYDINEPPPEVSDDEAVAIAHNLIGDDTIPIEIESTSLWANNRYHATRYTAGRVFCMGDACHRHPPTNGQGSNTSIQDAYNLAWKLKLVLDGTADPSLLDTYDAERAPVGELIVNRAAKSIEEFGPIFDALGLTSTRDAQQMQANMEARSNDTPQARQQRADLRKAVEQKNFEFNAHGTEMNIRYTSDAVVTDGQPEPEHPRDPELYYNPTTWPGARIPHCWLVRRATGEKVSTLDLVGKGRFTVLTGIGGEAWTDAATKVADQTGVDIASVLIGAGRDITDPYGDWAELSEIAEHGCLLVRPDAHVAWRAFELAVDPQGELDRVIHHILGRM